MNIHGIQQFCVLQNKAGNLDNRYKSHRSEWCCGFEENKELGGSLSNRDASVKKFYRSKQSEEGSEDLSCMS